VNHSRRQTKKAMWKTGTIGWPIAIVPAEAIATVAASSSGAPGVALDCRRRCRVGDGRSRSTATRSLA
jgi:hypothetical protein